MKVSYGSRCQRRLIYQALWMVLSRPFNNCFVLPSTGISRIIHTDIKRGLLLSKPNVSEVNSDAVAESVVSSKGEEKGYLSSDRWKEIVPNYRYPKLLRKVMTEMCRDMSPQEAFEFRLQSRLDYRFVPYGTKAPSALGEQGLVYYITAADFQSPQGYEIRTMIEDDDRYRVVWSNLDLPENHGTAIVLFLPEESQKRLENGDTTPWLSKLRGSALDSFPYFFRYLVSPFQFAAYLTLSFLGFLLIPVVGFIQIDEVMHRFMVILSVPPESFWYDVIYHTTGLFLIVVLSVAGAQLSVQALLKSADAYQKLWKGPEDG